MIIIYHSADLDGWTSAAILKARYYSAQLIGYNYGEPIPDILSGEEIVMVDVSFPIQDMIDIASKSLRLTWIDHHDRTISQFKEYIGDGETPLYGVFPGDIKQAACELTWSWVNGTKPTEAVRLLGAYDSFRHKGTDEEQSVLNFQYGARMLASNPEEAHRLIYLDKHSIEQVKDMGSHIHQYMCQEAKSKYSKGFEVLFGGYKFIVFNAERLNPLNFGINYHKDGYDGSACFWYEKGKWIFSLYNDNGEVDCAKICSLYGGGGHKGAAGFQIKDLTEIFSPTK